ncbi:MAG: preprotein translocase subunit SecG [Cycloclasticus sp. symbiont of Poecilosclerida sp. M]|nr:MAG: preprotein translocase subunit SecG [Cycloclasticus sp. symbiont of Poecilosclerida sp. M]
MSLFAILLSIHVLVAVLMVGFILIQQGKGADAGAAFGSGASGTVFGSQGSSSFLSRSTAILATVFFITSLSLAYVGANRSEPDDIVNKLTTPDVVVPADLAPEDLINNLVEQGEQKAEDVEVPVQDDIPTIPE